MAVRNYSNSATQATSSGFIDATTTLVTLTNFAGFPVAPYLASIDRGTVDEEIVLVTSVSGSAATVTRGYDGTNPKAHAAGATFQHVATALDFAEANGHVNATSGVHGVAGSLVGTATVQTLSNKTLTAPTITGQAVIPTGTAATAPVTKAQLDAAQSAAQIAALAADVTQITPGTSRTTGGYVTAATGWRVDSYTVRCAGAGWLYFDVQFTRTGAAVSVPPGSGNIGNQAVATFHNTLRPLLSSPAASMQTGRSANGYLNTTPTLSLTSVSGTDNIAVNEQLQLSGYAKLADPGGASALLG